LAFEDGEAERFDLRALQVGLARADQDQLIINLFRVSHVDGLVREVLGELVLVSLRLLLFKRVVMVNYLEPEGTVVFSSGLVRVVTLSLFFVSFFLRHSDQFISDEDWCLPEGFVNEVLSRDLLQLLYALHLVLQRSQIILQNSRVLF